MLAKKSLKDGMIVLAVVIAVKIILQVIAIHPVYELHRDEFLHVDLGYYPSWGYTSVPPVTGVLSMLIIALGKSVFLVKAIPVVFGVLLLVVLWKMIEALGGGHYALILGATCVLFSALLRINTLYQPNSLEYLVWIAVFYVMIRYIQTKFPKYLYASALLLALGLMNKYNIGFLIIGLIPSILFSEHRKLLANRHFYLAVLVMVAIVSPNIYWQYTHDWPVVRHMQTLASTQLVNVDRTGFFMDQFLFFIGGLPVIFAGFISFFRHPPFRKYRIFFWTFVIALALYAYLRAKSYYTIGFYPVFIAFGAVYLETLLRGGVLAKVVRPVLVLIPIALIGYLFPVVVPVKAPADIAKNNARFRMLGLLEWEDGREYALPQDFADMQGWKELAGLVDEAILQVDDRTLCIVQCDNYGQAGAINFYSNHNVRAYTMHADYIYWYPLEEMEVRDVILVKNWWDEDPGREREKALFDNVFKIGEIQNPYARERGTAVYLLKGARGSVNDVLREEIGRRLGTDD